MKRSPDSSDGASQGLMRISKLQCTHVNAVPVWCISLGKVFLNHEYSKAEQYDCFDYTCAECGAVFELFPTSEACRGVVGVFEITRHVGDLAQWNVLGKCSCEVEWVPVREK